MRSWEQLTVHRCRKAWAISLREDRWEPQSTSPTQLREQARPYLLAAPIPVARSVAINVSPSRDADNSNRPRSGRMIIAQQFTAGIVSKKSQSVKRTAEMISTRYLIFFSRSFHGLRLLFLDA